MAKLKPQALYDLTFVSAPVLSPDGRQVAVVQTHIESKDTIDSKDKDVPYYVSHIHLYDVDTGSSRQLTYTGSSHSSPKFSPDGTQLAFLAKRGEAENAQLYILPLSAGEARSVSSFAAGVLDFTWHPSSSSLILVSRGDWQDKVAERGAARVIDNLFYKNNGVGFKAQEIAQLYSLNLKTDKVDKLTSLKANPKGMAFAPDGKTLYFFAPEDSHAEDEWLMQLYSLNLKNKKIKPLLAAAVTGATTPSVSPDGSQLAFLAATREHNFGSVTGLWLVDASGGVPELLSNETAAAPSTGGDSNYGSYPNTPIWLNDSQLLINANIAGRSALATVDSSTKTLELHDERDRVITSFHHAAGTSSYTAEAPNLPGELFISQAGEERQLSNLNASFVKKYKLGLQEATTFTPKGGVPLSYWTLAPAKPRKDKALVLQVHGGPHTNYGYGFYLEFHILAAAGYTVVYGNPRGGTSFGQDFSLALQGQYGTVDADDVLAIAAHARKRLKRKHAPMHLTGGSYGGFMTNWLVGHSHEFRSAVTQRSISNWLSFYGASDIGYRFSETEVGGNPWQDTAKLWEQSPLKYVMNIETPLLIMHAEEDHRCPIEQAEQLFVALKRIGKAATRFVRFPGENHELSRSGRPDRRVERIELMLEWFEKHA